MEGRMRTVRNTISVSFKKEVISYIKAKYLLQGKKPPTTAEITDLIIKNDRIMKIIKNEINP